MKNYAAVVIAFLFVFTTSAFAANYVKPDIFKQLLETNKPLVVVDIQKKDDFENHHFKGSIETNSFPASSGEEKKLLDKAIEKIKTTRGVVVVVCPMGKMGARNAYDYIKSKGIPENRLYILEGGIAGWPYKKMLVKGTEK